MYNILVCDDERDIVNALSIYLKSEGYTVFSAYNGTQAIECVRREPIQLVLLDVMMPELDGLHALHAVREISNVPVILLTAKSEDTDKILGLNLGADDYITKPFNPVEVLARVRSQLRRYLHLGGGQKSSELVIGTVRLDDNAKAVTVDGEPVPLTPTEYDILKLLMENPDRVFSPQEIYRRIRGEDPCGAESTIAVHIRHLREKIEINPADPRYLRVKWGKGYWFGAEQKTTP